MSVSICSIITSDKYQKRVGVDGFISEYSLRVGFAVALAQAGQVWKSSQVPAHYAKAELAERGAIAKYKRNNHQVNHH